MITFRVDPTPALQRLDAAANRHIPFAVSSALNQTANDAQKAMQEGLRQRFRLRREAWNLRGIKINKEDRASKASWSVTIQVSPQTGYLNKFEQGGDKVPVGGHSYLWEPNEKFFRRRILNAGDPLRPKNLNLHRDPHGRVIGNSRTFMAPTGNSEVPYVVVMRQAKSTTYTKGSIKGLNLSNFGKKQLKASKKTGGTVTLYKLRKRIPIKAQLEFVETVEKTVHSRFRLRAEEALDNALRTAR